MGGGVWEELFGEEIEASFKAWRRGTAMIELLEVSLV